MKILNLWSLAGLGAAQRIDSSYSDERNDLTGPFGRLTTRQVPCQWAGWCDWSPCGATCGAEAVKSRTRDCACGPDIDPTSRGCVGDDHQVEPCGPEECPEALPKECWTQWSEWGECCEPCNGERTRSRSCTCGPPGCSECPGDNIESEPCNESQCSVGDWNLWSDCSVTCGKGQRQRQRDCICKDGQSPEDCGGCGDEPLEDWQPCMDEECAPKCNPGSWEPWSPCSTTCGNDGTRSRKRPCNSSCNPSNPDEAPEEVAPCEPKDCSPCAPPPCDCSVPECDQPDRCKEECAPPPCDCSIPECDQEERCKEECKPKEPECKWSNWSPFCSCSASCDEGTQRRTRNCYCGPDFDEPETDLPRPGCEGDSVEEEPCNNGPCEKCEPGDWAPWSECDCDTEPPIKTRERNCDCGPEICNDECTNQKQTCSIDECPLPAPKECKGPWNEWGPCDAVCGTGTRSRDRECLCGAPGCPGCDEDMSEEEECEGDDDLKCSVGEWSDFTPCDAECDQTGQMFRNRECICPPGLPEPTPEDCDCPDELEECKTCYGPKCSCPGEWEEWGPCDGPCNSGYRERIKPDPCLTDVDGNPAPPEIETESCGEPEVCEPGPWGEWSECDAECDQFGQMFRYRECDCPDGVSEEDEECGCDTSECETCKGPPCSCLGSWSEWTPCDGECGGGKRTRERNDPCVPDFVPEIEEEMCEEKLCTPTEWTEWTECDAPLGGWGQKFRYRDCEGDCDRENPDCGCGDLEECETCKGEPKCEWTGWEPTQPCSVTCGGGVEPRERNCKEKMSDNICNLPEDIDEGCPGAFKEESPCQIDACPPKCEYSPWTCWSECSATCGGGKKSRDRECNCPDGYPPNLCENNGQCDGEPREEEDCNTDVECPPECEFSPDWEPWLPCSKTCGGGTKSRQKKCECKNSDKCEGCEGIPPTDYIECNTEPCTCWGDWAPWSECPDACGKDVRTRERDNICEHISAPEGEAMETEICPGDSCNWGCWNEWSECDSPCDEGSRTRSRECNCPPGTSIDECPCIGEPDESEPCDLPSCEDQCDIGEWCGWSDCDSECGPGQQTRVRTCDCPAGTECPVPTEESRECPEDEQTECAPEPTCSWTPWCNWSDCSGDCGDQTRARSRMCDCGDQPECETKDQECPGPDLEEEPCVEETTCKGDCEYHDWSEWGVCETPFNGNSCTDSTRSRNRQCPCDSCDGEMTETENCTPLECTEGECVGLRACEHCEPDSGNEGQCEFGDWCEWGACSKPCNGGTQTRSRPCPCGNCDGDPFETRECNTHCCPDMPQPQDGEKFCGARINYRTKEPATCCADRSDDCTFIMSDGRPCFCDAYCIREEGDCCPDYVDECMPNIQPTMVPTPAFTPRVPEGDPGCTYNGSKFSTGGSTKSNCNVCTCESSGSMNCEQSSCLVDLEIIESVNINNDNNWKATNHSQFWGQTLAQGQGFYLGTLKPTDDVMQMGSVDSLGEPDDIPSEYDLRDETVLSVLDQGKCGASYAFSTAHVFNTRSAMAKKQGERDELGSEQKISTQHMVSCITPGGCGGGRLADTWFHIKNQGSMDEQCYGPYTSGRNNDTDVCQAKLRTECSPLMSGPAYKLACEEDIQRDIINYGPVQAIMSVSHDFYHYSSGVYKSTMSPVDDDMMHSVALIGWGNEKGVPYWIAMNSWGPEWGVGGYFKILRGQNESNIESFVIGSHPDLHGHS